MKELVVYIYRVEQVLSYVALPGFYSSPELTSQVNYWLYRWPFAF